MLTTVRELEHNSLNYQYYLISQLTEHELLHPSTREKIDLLTPGRIADIGTGTAIWPAELAQSLPDWQIDGFDISGDQYPLAHWLPSNVTLHEHDAFQPFPEEHLGKYDIINVRFFMTLLSGQNLPQLLQNVMSLLKPSGIFQWMDIDAPSVKAIGPDPTKLESTSTVATLMQTNPPDAASWITHNCDMVKPAGFEPVSWGEFRLKDIHRPIWNQCVMMGLEEMTQGLEQSGDQALLAKAEGLRALLKNLSIEFGQGASLDTTWFYLVAQKPTN
ncbi:hypothetical protein N7454_009856 [Penicillium verhagenii]|nr:hypothetical protein N7454_009856 [Penicillium verhagenii]